jgi:hypothetical protein
MILDELNQNIEFTKSVLEEGDSELQLKDGQRFSIQLKLLFDPKVLIINKYAASHDLNTLLGFNPPLDLNESVTIQARLGFFCSQVSKVIHRAVSQMCLGEKAHVSFELSSLLLDEALKHRKLYENQLDQEVFLDIKLEITLTEIETNVSVPNVYDMSRNELYKLAEEHKQEANGLYLKNLVHTAFDRYHQSISYVIIAQQSLNESLKMKAIQEEEENSGENSSETEFRAKLNLLKSQLYSNLAACQLKSFNYSQAVVNCDKCLELDKKNVKAVFRRAQAYMHMNEYEKSIQDLTVAVDMDPENKEIKLKLNQVEQMKKDYHQTMASKLKKMFN